MAVTLNASTTSGFVQAADTSGELQLQNTGVTAVTIKSDGNVGIGTASPTAKLHVGRTAGGVGVVTGVNAVFNADSNIQYGGIQINSYDDNDKRFVIINDNGITSLFGYGVNSVVNLGTNSAQPVLISTNNTERMRIHASGGVSIGNTTDPGATNLSVTGNLQFNSGYGSVATAYGCRAWVNFDGTGTPAIRGSGNVTSITDNGTGIFTVNFTNAMPDSNYAALASAGTGATGGEGVTGLPATTPSASSIRVETTTDAGTLTDRAYISVVIFR